MLIDWNLEIYKGFGEYTESNVIESFEEESNLCI